MLLQQHYDRAATIFIGLDHGKQQVLKKMDDFFSTKTLFYVTYLTSINLCIFFYKETSLKTLVTKKLFASNCK